METQLSIVTLVSSFFGLFFSLAGMAFVIMPLLESDPGGQNGSILPTIAAGLGAGWIGLVFWFVAWRNRPWRPHKQSRPQ